MDLMRTRNRIVDEAMKSNIFRFVVSDQVRKRSRAPTIARARGTKLRLRATQSRFRAPRVSVVTQSTLPANFRDPNMPEQREI